jgi:predicted TIM-barrel fold metal-dependent hydrolase
VSRAGARKLLFGSDGPWLHPGLELQKIRLIGLPAADEALILGDNARRLIYQSRPSVPTMRVTLAGSAIRHGAPG